MPYVNDEQRKKYKTVTDEIQKLIGIETKGDLEYLVFYLMKKYMQSRQYRYSLLHDCTYAVQHCSDEFKRRFLDKREDEARLTNGDICEG